MLLLGFQQLLHPMTLLMCLFGVVIGTLTGVLPGLGPSAALAILLPVIYGRDPLTSLVLLAGIYYGAMYGGMITSVLINVPGDSAAVVTTFDGYPMAQQGRGGVAMGIGAFSSFIAGTIGVILLTVLAVPLARMALKFGPPEYFAIYLLTFIAILSLGGGDLVKSAISLILGLLVSTVGMDVMSGAPRLTYGTLNLMAGIDFLPAVVGMFGLAEIVRDIARGTGYSLTKEKSKVDMRSVLPRPHDLLQVLPTILRCGFMGFCVGVLPGAGSVIATFMAYGMEKQISKDPDSFGKGNPRGVAAPEAANNGACEGAFVPLLSLGIPGSSAAAILLGAFILVGVQPGPRLFETNPELVWGLIASMYVGNVMLILINTAFIPAFVYLLRISQKTLCVVVATLCVIGTYSLHNSLFDVFLMLVFTVVGYFFKELNIPASPLIIAIVLGGDIEFSLRQSLSLFKGNVSMFLGRPICVVIFIVCILLMALPFVRGRRKKGA